MTADGRHITPLFKSPHAPKPATGAGERDQHHPPRLSTSSPTALSLSRGGRHIVLQSQHNIKPLAATDEASEGDKWSGRRCGMEFQGVQWRRSPAEIEIKRKIETHSLRLDSAAETVLHRNTSVASSL